MNFCIKPLIGSVKRSVSQHPEAVVRQLSPVHVEIATGTV